MHTKCMNTYVISHVSLQFLMTVFFIYLASAELCCFGVSAGKKEVEDRLYCSSKRGNEENRTGGKSCCCERDYCEINCGKVIGGLKKIYLTITLDVGVPVITLLFVCLSIHYFSCTVSITW